MNNAEKQIINETVQGGPTLVVLTKKQTTDALDVVTFNKTARQHIREFACIIAIVSYLFAGAKLYKLPSAPGAYNWIVFGTLFLIAGYALPRLMHPVWKGWMKFAVGLGMVMSTVIVSIAWVLMFWPCGIIFKIIGKKVMDLTYKAPVTTYWEIRDEKLNDFKLLERQY